MVFGESILCLLRILVGANTLRPGRALGLRGVLRVSCFGALVLQGLGFWGVWRGLGC